MSEKTTLQVKGMSCGHCVKAVENSVSALNGVATVQVQLDAGTVEIEFNPSEVTIATITETIEDQGYDVIQ